MAQPPGQNSADGKSKKEIKPKRRWGGLRRLNTIVPAVTRDTLSRRGFLQGEVVARWRDIVGPNLADHTVPERLAFPRGDRHGANLVIRVAPGLAPELQHSSPRVIERINAYFGYGAVASLKLIQAPVPPPVVSQRRQRRSLNRTEVKAVRDEVAGTRDPDLRRALERLGCSLKAAKPDPTS
jgi:hypothetical protein